MRTFFDANFLAEQGHFLDQAIVLSFEPHPLVAAVGGPTPAVDQGILSQSDYMDNSGFDVGAPALGQRYLGLTVFITTCPVAVSARSTSCNVSGDSPTTLRRPSRDTSAAPAWAMIVARRSAWGGLSGRFLSQSWKVGAGMEVCMGADTASGIA